MKAETSDVAKSAVDAAILRKPPGKVIGATSFILKQKHLAYINF
jgi:hypothetical protein